MLLVGLTGSIATGKSTVSRILSSPPHNLSIVDADLLARKVVEPGTKGYWRIVQEFGEEVLLLDEPKPESNAYEEGSEEEKKKKKVGGILALRDANKSEEAHHKLRPIDRAALGRVVFGDTPEKQRRRKILNSIIHPAVRWEMCKSIFYHYLRGEWAVVLDVPLLFEGGLDLWCGCVVVVAMSEAEKQVERLVERDRGGGGAAARMGRATDGQQGLTESEAWERIKSQWSVMDKADRCHLRDRPHFSWILSWVWSWFRQLPPPLQVYVPSALPSRGLVIWNDGSKDELKREVDRKVVRLRRSSPAWWTWACLLLSPLGIAAGLVQVVLNILDRRYWNNTKQQ